MRTASNYIKSLKRILGILFLLMGFIMWNAKTNTNTFENYTQVIPHTDLNFEMNAIPEGEFLMGSTENEKYFYEDEYPKRKVRIDAFWMASHEVTWDLFELFLDKNYEKAISSKPLPESVDGLSRPSTPYLDMTFGMGKDNKPAIGMTQYGAIQFCKWLYVKTGVFYRLPTEAEWEYAARAGLQRIAEAESLLEYAVFESNSEGQTMQVGSKSPNPWGLYDMLGNVMEWTFDHYAPYESNGELLNNPVVLSESLYPKVLRGGHYESKESDLTFSRRFASSPEWKQLDPQIPKSQWWFPEAPFVGMRIVRPLVTPSENEIWAYYDKIPIADY